jgi:hypothetical protein
MAVWRCGKAGSLLGMAGHDRVGIGDWRRLLSARLVEKQSSAVPNRPHLAIRNKLFLLQIPTVLLSA